MSASRLAQKHICTTADAPEDSPAHRTRGVALKERLWPSGKTIRIHFLNGSVAQQRFVERVASLWLAHINLHFQWNVARIDSDVRVRFQEGGSWSYIGTDNEKIDKEKVTMNFGWLPLEPAGASDRGVVLHEFGHMLGLSHEHQSPRNGVTWIREAVIADLGQPPHEWSVKKIEHNVLFRYSDDNEDVVTTDSFDARSIMTYSFPAEWNEEGIEVRRRRSLSRDDKRFVQSLYPFSEVENGRKLKMGRFWTIRVRNWLHVGYNALTLRC